MSTSRMILAASALTLVLASCAGTTFRCDPTLSWTTDPPRVDAAVPFEREPMPEVPACTGDRCPVSDVAAGPESTCVSVAGGGITGVICFGANEHGQSAPSSAGSDEAPPTWIARRSTGDGGVSPWSGGGGEMPVVGGAHACAMIEGTLRCWGHPALTGGAPGEIVSIPLPARVGEPSAGALHTCASTGASELSDGTAFCFGAWDGFDPAAGVAHPPRAIPAVSWVTTAAGFRSCGFDSSRAAVCWGGVPTDGRPSPGAWARPPTPLHSTLGPWLALGSEHACAFAVESESDRLRCWGRGDRGQLGDGARTSSDAPVVVDLLPDRAFGALCVGGAGAARQRADGTLSVSAQPGFTCASLLDRVWCWGANDRGQLGDGTTIDRAVPTRVEDLRDVTALACGGAHVCARTWLGRLWCWGANDHGQLGIPSSELDGSTVPLEVDVSPRGE